MLSNACDNNKQRKRKEKQALKELFALEQGAALMHEQITFVQLPVPQDSGGEIADQEGRWGCSDYLPSSVPRPSSSSPFSDSISTLLSCIALPLVQQFSYDKLQCRTQFSRPTIICFSFRSCTRFLCLDIYKFFIVPRLSGTQRSHPALCPIKEEGVGFLRSPDHSHRLLHLFSR